jgi:hypothetical protein
LKRQQSRPLALISVLALGVTGSALAQTYRRTVAYDSLPAGTVLMVRLDDRLNSAEARPGQRVTATVRGEEDHSGLPEGSGVEGVVRAAQPASQSRPGVLDVDFTGLSLPNGQVYPIHGSLTSLDTKSVTRTASGRLVSKRGSKSERMKFIGYGAGAGALIGLLTGGNLLKDALLGGAGGYLYDQLKKDKPQGRYRDVNLKEGAEFGVRLDQRFAYLPVSDQRPDGSDRYDEPTAPRNPLGGRSDGNRLDRSRSDRAGIAVVADDRRVNFGAIRPMRVDSRVMVPVTPVMKATGTRYQYDRLAGKITTTGDERKVSATLNSSVAWVDGDRVSLGAPVRLIQGALYVPERFLELATGMSAQWDEGSQTLRLNTHDRDRNLDRDRSVPGTER